MGHAIRVEIVRWVDDRFPGIVECRIMDADGAEHLFIEKLPIVTSENFDRNIAYPRPGMIACRIVEYLCDPGRRARVVVDMEEPWHVESTAGLTRFILHSEQLAAL
ncbi:MAG TPA: hypothetical protein VHI13_00700 [Candidatus Kapabacteria bacterium]|nr:hypothetical protein [Candidatus Kapabacteria bacterium]